jgi:hypothetical protein
MDPLCRGCASSEPYGPTGAVVVVVGTVVVVVVVVDGWVVVVVVGGRVVGVGLTVVVVVGGTVVVVGLLPGAPVESGGGTKVHMPKAQFAGWAATTTSTPGNALKVHTPMGGPVWRQASAGAVVINELNVPRYCTVPNEVGGVTGVRATVMPFHTPVVAKPVPGGMLGAVTVGPVW